MKVAVLLKFRTRLLRRRNRAQRAFTAELHTPLNHGRARLDSEVTTLDRVLDDLDHLIKKNHDVWHDRRRE